ncbi:tetratricopeptide repeat protein [Aliikangiella sp. IMCC44653]
MNKVIVVFILAFLSGCAAKPSVSRSNAAEVEARAEEYYRSANLQLAEAEFRELLKITPRYAKAWFRLGNIYLRTNQLDAAINHYEKSLEYDRTQAKAWHNLALARVRQATATLVEGQSNINSKQTAELDFLLKKLLELQKSG